MADVREASLFDTLVPQYQAEGFDVFVNPSPSILPTFMRPYRPDAIALRSDRKIAIEVVHSKQEPSKKIDDLEALFKSHSDWEFRVFYIAPFASDGSPPAADAIAIASSIQRVRELKQAGHKLPALVMAWATLEAVGRALLPYRLERPQTPARLIEVLASDGILTPTEADVLRATIPLRNRIVHGAVGSDVDDKLLEKFIDALTAVSKFLTQKPANA